MTSAPVVPAVAETWYDELQVTQPGDPDRGWPLLILLGALGIAFGPLHDIVRDTDAGPGWSQVMDPDRCPGWALPWLAQFAGVRLTASMPESEQRARITSPPAFERGTRAAMRAAATPYLTGTQQVRIIERDGGAYNVTVITSTSETPDPAVVEAAVRAQKPAGLLLTYLTSDAPLINEGTLNIDDVPASVTIDNAVIGDV